MSAELTRIAFKDASVQRLRELPAEIAKGMVYELLEAARAVHGDLPERVNFVLVLEECGGDDAD